MLITLLGILITLVVFFVKYNYSYWTRKGIPQDENNKAFIGCLTPVIKGDTNPGGCMNNLYFRTKGDYVGVYILYRPALLIRNVELARDVLISNFTSFHDRGVFDGGKNDPLYTNLFSGKGSEWKTMRQKLSPSFTSGKIKVIFQSSDEVGTKLVEYVNKKIGDKDVKEIDVRNVFTTYAIDIIASAVFGLNINGFENPHNRFTDVVTEFASHSVRNITFTALSFLLPNIYWYVRNVGFGIKSLEKLKSIMAESIEIRQKNGIIRKDILQLLMQLQAQGKINENDDDWTIKADTDNKNSKNFTLDHLTSQSFLFYIAGQETTAATASFTIAEMAMHPEILKKAQKDVDEVMEKHNGIFSYEALQEMEYLELCMKETLRKYPGLPMLNRECTQDFTIPGTDKIIKKGTPIILPIMAYQRDPENFPDPDDYNPDRFLSNFNFNAYMPFGEGPRICIAARLGKINSKLAVAKVLYFFNIEPMAKKTYEIEPQTPTVMPKGGVRVKMSKRLKT